MRGVVGVVPLIFLTACAVGERPYDPERLREIYGPSARIADPERNPVVVVPGILGSRLVDGPSGRVVWGAFGRDSVDPEDPADAPIVALPLREGAPLADLMDGVRPDGILQTLEIDVAGLPIELRAYADLTSILAAGGYRDPALGGEGPFTAFQFDYDWRRDLVESARRLHVFLLEKRTRVRESIRERTGVVDADIRFDVVAHSMGALVARYYVMYGDAELPAEGVAPRPPWAGRRLVDRLILVGPPSGGGVQALERLVQGESFAGLSFYDPTLLGTMPSIYELLPRSRHRPVEGVSDLLDPAVWVERGWGLASPSAAAMLATLLPGDDPAARRRIALDHLAKCLDRARRFQAALDVPVAEGEGGPIDLYAGDGSDTPSRLALDPETGELRRIEWAPGDGSVSERTHRRALGGAV